jgi:hypothetical protein
MPLADKKLHKPVLDHNGKPYSPAQILALERAELTRVRVKRDSMYLALERDQLIQTDVVIRQAAALFLACRQKLLAMPHHLSKRLEGKDHRTIFDALTKEIHKALREMADFSQKVVNPDWNPEDGDEDTSPLIDPPQSQAQTERSKSKPLRRRLRKRSS